ncbi:hypothetical protein Bca4012_093429 [Brassica carinata]
MTMARYGNDDGAIRRRRCGDDDGAMQRRRWRDAETGDDDGDTTEMTMEAMRRRRHNFVFVEIFIKPALNFWEGDRRQIFTTNFWRIPPFVPILLEFFSPTKGNRNHYRLYSSSSLTSFFTPSLHSFNDLSLNAPLLLPTRESAAINRIEYASLLLQDSKAGRCTRTRCSC